MAPRMLQSVGAVALTMLGWSGTATAQSVVTSDSPDSVSVTTYRAVDRGAEDAIDRDDPRGFALITETRTVMLPTGRGVIRFEGVAGNIMPESALVSGLPGAVEEKNLDADLLSPRSLFDRALGRRVIIRRTDRATGRVIDQQATIRSSSAGAAILQIGKDFADLRCSGLPETLIYDGIPPGLSARPTLSIQTDSPTAQRVTLTLSYLAGGFDWQADYIVALHKDGSTADLFAWVTLASSDVTSFADAQAQVVAGKLNRENDNRRRGGGGDAGDLRLKCWPMPSYYYGRPVFRRGLEAESLDEASSEDVIITGSRMRFAAAGSPIPVALLASAEQLGDLKLYRFPARVTVASKAQKQVALLNKPGIKLTSVYVSEIRYDDVTTSLVLRGRNRKEDGLGIALPQGRVAVFADAAGLPVLMGESATDDKSVGEDVEFKLGESADVRAQLVILRDEDRSRRLQLTATNATNRQVRYEARIAVPEGATITGGKLRRKGDRSVWAVTIPASGTATLSYIVTAAPPKSDND